MTQARLTFWQRWLVVVAGTTALFGLGFILTPSLMETLFNALLFQGAGTDALFGAEAARYIRFVYGVLGAVMMGWGVCIAIIAAGAFGRRDRSAWNAIAGSIGLWFVVDSLFSLTSGFAANAALNVGFFVLYLIPLAATWGVFHGAGRAQSAA